MDGSLQPLRLVATAVLAALGLIVAAALADAAEIGSARKIVNKVYGATVLRGLRMGEAITDRQALGTGADSAVELKLTDDVSILVGEQANLRFGPRDIEVTQGALRVAIPAASKREIALRTETATVTARGATFDVLALPGATDVAVHDGQVAVKTRSGTATVNAGEVFRASLGLKPEAMPTPSPEMRFGVRKMLAMLDVSAATSPQAKKEAAQALAALEATSAFKGAIKGKKPESLIYLDTTNGRIVIETLPNAAPRHIARIRELARAKFYDGLVFHSVMPGAFAETGDPTGTGLGGSGAPMKPELSQASFVRGSVGMARARNGTDDSRFFIALGPARYLDSTTTAWGRVIFGIDIADKLKPGAPPGEPDRIVAMKFAAEPKPGSAEDAIRIPCRDSDRRLGSC